MALRRSELIQHKLGFWTVAQKPSPAELQEYYATKYFQDGRGSYESSYTDAEKSYFFAKIEQRHAVLRQIVPNASSMLDVGCGEGFALAYFKKQGWQVKGFDFSQAGLKAQNPDCLEALCVGDVFALLDAEVISGRKYDVIWIQNVLEHVLEPLGLLASLHSIVSDGGVVLVTVPNDVTFLQKEALLRGHIDHEFWVATPDHISYFNHITLPAAAAAAGWKCMELLGDFPIDWFLFHNGSNYIKNSAMGKSAHNARVTLENLFHKTEGNRMLAFWSAAGSVGIGRDITAFLQNSSRAQTQQSESPLAK